MNPKENAFLSKFFIRGCFIFWAKKKENESVKRNISINLIDSITQSVPLCCVYLTPVYMVAIPPDTRDDFTSL